VMGTLIFVGASILEHLWDKNLASYVFLFLAAAVFCWGAYAAWDDADKKIKELKEKLSDRYPRLVGEIVLGYLDFGKQCDKGRWVDSASGAVATFYVKIVNHSTQDAWLMSGPGLRMTIGGTEYVGTYTTPSPQALSVNDTELKGDRRISDLFSFGIGGMAGVLQKPRLHPGWLMFNLEGLKDQLESNPDVIGSATITLGDTLGGVHAMNAPDLHFRLNRIGGQ